MALAALHSGCVDLALPPDRIAAELARIGSHPYLAATAPGEERDDGRIAHAGLSAVHR